jgi:urease accessory protein
MTAAPMPCRNCRRTTITIMAEPDGTPWLLRLMTWLSPAYPVGAFSYSHGLEWAVETRAVHDRETLTQYITTALEAGGGWSDLVLLAASWRAAQIPDEAALDAVADLAAALRGTAETALESASQGAAFVRATLAAWPGTALDDLAARRDGQVAYPVAIGAATSLVPLGAVLAAYAQAFAANIVSAGVRLVPLGQTDGLRVLAALTPVIARVALAATAAPLDEFGTAAPGIDFCSMRHETQYTRLFRS